MQANILAPAAVLVIWTLIMLVWMAASRLPAMKAMGGGLGKSRPGGRGQDLEGRIDDRVNWKAHNYTHLMEQPTIFYPVVIVLAIMGSGPVDVLFAWAYVLIRILHSVWQATVNRLPVRFALFLVSTVCLIVLAIRVLALTLFADPAVLS